LRLADVYSVIAYYLHHQPQVIEYLNGRRQTAARIREANERHSDPAGIRDRLLARRR
jgi:hypothetical protein